MLARDTYLQKEHRHMKQTAILLSALTLAGCMSHTPIIPITSFTPTIDPDGNQKFIFAASADFPDSYNIPPDGVEEAHMGLLSAEIGRRQICLKGYTITAKQQGAYNIITYTGQCK